MLGWQCSIGGKSVRAVSGRAAAADSCRLGRRPNVQFFCHAVLITLMLVASLIDIDEKTIPDAIVVPGTLLGLAAAALYPWSLLPANVAAAPGEFLLLTSPRPWIAWLDGARTSDRWGWRWPAFGSGVSP